MNAGNSPAREIALLLSLAAIVYSNTLAGGFVWDDIPLAVQSPSVRESASIPALFALGFFPERGFDPERGPRDYWRPLTLVSLALDRAFWGMNPYGYHLTNLLLHALNTVLLLLLLRMIPAARPAALWAALLFSVHPLQTNAVAYISGRTDLIAALFFLFACVLFLRGVSSARSPAIPAAAMGLCIWLSLLSKEAALAAPLLLPLLGFLAGARASRRMGMLTAVLLAAAALYVLCRAFLGIPMGGRSSLDAALSPWNLFAVAESALLYARLFLLPVGLHMERFLTVPHVLSARALACAAVSLFALCAALRAAVRGVKAAAFFCWAIVAFLPASNLLPLYPEIARRELFLGEQFMYLPLIGVSAALALLMHDAAAAFPRRSSAIRLCGSAALACMASLSIAHNGYWTDEFTFYTRTIRLSPGSVRMRTNLGLLHAREGRFAEAVGLLGPVVEQNPASALARFNLGSAYRRMGNLVLARHQLERSRAISPSSYETLNELGLVALAEGKAAEAVSLFNESSSLAPLFTAPRVNLAVALLRTGDASAAERSLREAYRAAPGILPEIMILFAVCHDAMGMRQEAADEYRRVIARGYPGAKLATEKLPLLLKE